jgi:hypothetical protein
MSAMPIAAPVQQNILNQHSVGASPPPVWPSAGAVTTFNWSNTTLYPPGTALETITGWSLLAGNAGAAVIAGGYLSFTGPATDSCYGKDTGSPIHWMEVDLHNGPTISSIVCVRVIDGNNYLGARVNGANVQLYSKVGGTYTQLYNSTQTIGNVIGTYRLEATGADIVNLYFAGRLLYTGAVPSALTNATMVGFAPRAAAATSNYIAATRIYSGPVLHGLTGGAWCWFHEPRAISASAPVIDAARVAASMTVQGRGKTWFCTTQITDIDGTPNDAGILVINEIVHESGAVTSYTVASGLYLDDDHAYPSLLVRPDGRLVTFYCAHRDTTGMNVRISVNPYDASAWSAPQLISAIVTGGYNCTYPSPVMLSGESNTVYLFYRGGPTASTNMMAVTSATLATATAPASDGAAAGTITWGTPTAWVGCTGSQGVYAKIWNDGVSRIDFAVTDAYGDTHNPHYDARHCYYQAGSLRLSSGKPLLGANFSASACTISGTTLTVGGTITGTVAVGQIVQGNGVTQGSQIIALGTGAGAAGTYTLSLSSTVASAEAMTGVAGVSMMTPIATSGAPDNWGDMWVWDIFRDNSNGYVYVTFVRFLSTTNHQYYFAVWNGWTWARNVIPNANSSYIVNSAAGSTELYYSPGVVLDSQKPGVVYASVGGWNSTILYRYITTDLGNTWTSQQISPGSISGDVYGGANVRPVVPRNRDPHYAVLWLRGGYDYYDSLIPGTAGGYHTEIMSTKF